MSLVSDASRILQGAKTHIVGQFAQFIKVNFNVDFTKDSKVSVQIFLIYVLSYLSKKNTKK